jgi:hypothetical protein
MRYSAGIVVAGLLLAAAVVFAAVEFSSAFVAARTADRIVTVK